MVAEGTVVGDNRWPGCVLVGLPLWLSAWFVCGWFHGGGCGRLMVVAADGSMVAGGGGAMVVHRRENMTRRERPRWNLQIEKECGTQFLYL